MIIPETDIPVIPNLLELAEFGVKTWAPGGRPQGGKSDNSSEGALRPRELSQKISPLVDGV